MNKIRVIDLLNKMANREELPKKIKYDDTIFTLRPNNVYVAEYDENGMERLLDHLYYDFSDLNNEVEIIEDEIDIDSIEELETNTTINSHYPDHVRELEIRTRINTVIRAIKQQQREIDELKED